MLANNYDPIARGYVTSLARPGGRITGLFYRQPELAQKRVELSTLGSTTPSPAGWATGPLSRNCKSSVSPRAATSSSIMAAPICGQGFRRCGCDGALECSGHCRQRLRIAAAGR
jgi:hypothetical protein